MGANSISRNRLRSWRIRLIPVCASPAAGHSCPSSFLLRKRGRRTDRNVCFTTGKNACATSWNCALEGVAPGLAHLHARPVPSVPLDIALVILDADPARGGAERYTVDLAHALAGRGHATSLLASSFAEVNESVR